MFERIENTVADGDAKKYESDGKTQQEAWQLVVDRFLERTKNMTKVARERYGDQYFKIVGQMV